MQIVDYSQETSYQFVKDAKGRIWITTKNSGFLQYDPRNNRLISHLHDGNKRWSPMSNFYISLFCDKEGIVWMGGHNLSFFHPDKQLFTRTLPFETKLDLSTRRYARCVVEDKDHNLWFGTRDGVCKYDTKTYARQEWRNEEKLGGVV